MCLLLSHVHAEMGEAIKELPLNMKGSICSEAVTAACGMYSFVLFCFFPAHYFTEHMAVKRQKELMLLHCVAGRNDATSTKYL